MSKNQKYAQHVRTGNGNVTLWWVNCGIVHKKQRRQKANKDDTNLYLQIVQCDKNSEMMPWTPARFIALVDLYLDIMKSWLKSNKS